MVVKELKGQINLFPKTPEDRLREIEEKSQVVSGLEMDVARARAVYELNRDRLKKESGELRILLSPEGMQQSIAEAVRAIKEDIKPPELVVETVEQHTERRRKEHEDAAIKIVTACGGMIPNAQLASLLNLDPHGVAGRLCKCARLERVYHGKQGSQELYWKLK